MSNHLFEAKVSATVELGPNEENPFPVPDGFSFATTRTFHVLEPPQDRDSYLKRNSKTTIELSDGLEKANNFLSIKVEPFNPDAPDGVRFKFSGPWKKMNSESVVLFGDEIESAELKIENKTNDPVKVTASWIKTSGKPQNFSIAQLAPSPACQVSIESDQLEEVT